MTAHGITDLISPTAGPVAAPVSIPFNGAAGPERTGLPDLLMKPITIKESDLSEVVENSPYADWNRGSTRFTKNCQAFAYNSVTPDTSNLPPGDFEGNIPVPGKMGGKEVSAPFTVSKFRDALTADGCKVLSGDDQKNIVAPEGHHLIAAFINAELDNYHFLRRDEKSGEWYHKPDWEHPVTRLDLSGKAIDDPLTADLEIYKTFVGFALVPEAGIPLDIIIRPSGNSESDSPASKTGPDDRGPSPSNIIDLKSSPAGPGR